MDTLVRVGLTNGLFAALLALIVAGILVFCRGRPAVVHGLWILVMVKFLVPSFYPIEIPCWRAAPERTLSPKLADRKENSAPVSLAEELPTETEAPSLDPSQFETPSAPIENLGSEELESQPVAPAPSPVNWNLSWEHVVAMTWLAGSLTWSVVAGIRILRFRRILRLAQCADQSVHDRVRELARRIGLSICPEVSMVAAPVAPLLWALGRSPRLLIPSRLWGRLSEEQRDTLLVHELAHLRRGDHWVRRLEILVFAIYWWHPVVWWAQRRLREVEEECCDAWVLWALPKAGPSYAVALVETVDFVSHTRPILPLGASGIEPLRFLKRRIAMIVRGQTPRAMSRLAFWSVIGLGAILLPLLPIPAQQPGGSEGEDETAQTPPIQEPPSGSPDQPALGIAAMRQDRSEQIEAAKDQVELMEAKLMIKRAEVEEMNLRIRQAQRNLERLGELYKRGALEEAAFNKARNETELLPTQLPIKKAELAEAEILLKQASRRLARLEMTPPPDSSTATGSGLGMRPAGKGPMSGAGPAPGRPGMMGPGGSAPRMGSMAGAPDGSNAPAGGAQPGAGARNPGGGPTGGGSDSTGAPGAGALPPGMGATGGPGGLPPGKGSAATGRPGGGPPMMGGPGMSSMSGMAPKGGMGGMGMPGASSGPKGMMAGMGMPTVSGGGSMSMTTEPGTSISRLEQSRQFDSLFDLKSWDFGSARRGERLRHTFQLTNNLDHAIHLSALRVSGAFLLVSGRSGWIAPKETIPITVEMDTRRFSGEKTALAYVQFDQPSAAEIRLQVQGHSQDAASTGSAQGQSQDSKAKVQELENKVDQLMKQIDALRIELKQPAPKGGGGSGPPPLPDDGTNHGNPANH